MPAIFSPYKTIHSCTMGFAPPSMSRTRSIPIVANNTNAILYIKNANTASTFSNIP